MIDETIYTLYGYDVGRMTIKSTQLLAKGIQSGGFIHAINLLTSGLLTVNVMLSY